MAERVIRETTVHDRPAADVEPVGERGANIIARIIWFITGVILILLAFRFLLSLLGANRTNGFANFIYSASHPFVAPFFGLFNYNVVDYGSSRFEIYTLFAMLVYAAIGWGLAYLATIGSRRTA
jgi:hypothetical protein